METKKLDNKYSYLLGFLQSDGHRLLRHPNAFSLELSDRDVDILYKIKRLFSMPNIVRTRTRDTNYSDDYTSCSIHINARPISNIIDFIPCGSKSEIVQPPIGASYSEPDYWRGFIDGDGSIGFRKTSPNKKNNFEPFISLATSSEYIARAFEQFIFTHFYSKNQSSRNKRDDQFNITIAGYYCFPIIKSLYYPECLGLDRKIAEALAILQSDFMANQKRTPFSREEDAALLMQVSQKTIILPNRKNSVAKRRLKYLLSKGIDSQKKLFDMRYFI